MNSYSAKHNVLVMNNACIYYNNNLIRAVEEMKGQILYLPSYFSNYNLIKFVFSIVKS